MLDWASLLDRLFRKLVSEDVQHHHHFLKAELDWAGKKSLQWQLLLAMVGKMADDRFRASFLHGRMPMLASCAARLRGSTGLTWVDMGGGTAENIDMMSQFIDLESFDKIYVVDICSALCEVARQKVISQGWHNVEVVEGDACTFTPATPATLITFSYSLTSKSWTTNFVSAEFHRHMMQRHFMYFLFVPQQSDPLLLFLFLVIQ